MYQQQYPGQGVGPGNGPAMHHQQHHMLPQQQQQQQPRQTFYQPPIRMAGPNHPGPRMPLMQNNSPRGPMVQGGPPQQGHNGPTDLGYPNPNGNGHIPQAPPPTPPQQPQQQQQPVYTYTVSNPQQPFIMLQHPGMQGVRQSFNILT